MKFDIPQTQHPGLSRQQRRGAQRAAVKPLVKQYKRFKWSPPPPKQAPAATDAVSQLTQVQRVLDREHHDPAKQIPLKLLVSRIIVLAQVMLEKRYYAYQVSLAKRVVESVLEHDGEVVTALFSRQSGKCLAKGTRVLMFDGSTKAVEDIMVGDRLMGDDSTARTVLSLARGTENLWEVKPRCDYAESFTVNESHILSLKKKDKQGSATYVDLPLTRYQKCQDWEKDSKFSSYKVAVNYPDAEVGIDPYWLGLWLGDGNSRSTTITCGDFEIGEYVQSYASSLGMRLSVYEEKGACAGFAIVNWSPWRFRPNSLVKQLERYGLLQNKHVPLDYLANSRAKRLDLLAGIIDTGGSKTKFGFEITLTNHRLASDVQSLARSLGYRCSLKRRVAACQTGACSVAWRLSLYGELWEVPVKVARKKFTSKQLREDPRSFGFDLVPKGKGNYYGFVIDKNHRFLLADYTVTHNTETIGGLSGALAVILPQLAKMYPDDWRLNITDSQGNYRGFARGFSIGIYAPKQEQSAITFERARRAVETKSGKRVLKELKIDFEENNGNTLAFTNGSRLLCQSASKQSEIEGATHHLLIAEEAQDLDDLKVRKSLHPMVASTMGSIVKIGTASTFKCDFYNAIQNNRREELLSPGKRNHFYFPWTVCAKYNSLYAKYIEGEKKRLGEQSDEFRMAYMVEWIFERGMFITHDVLFSPEVSQVGGLWSVFYNNGVSHIKSLGHYSIVAGIDWGRSSDSTVVCLMAVDWMNPLETGSSTNSEGVHSFMFFKKHVIALWEYTGDNYEYQFGEITSRLDGIRGLRKIVMDSNSCGSPIYDRFAAVYGTRGIEVAPFNFQPKVKSDGYKSFSSDLWAGRLTMPAGPAVRRTMEFRKCATQTLDLKKEWKNGVMHVSHPDERGAHDDFPDAVMLAAWGCNVPALGGRVELSGTNPFYSN